MDKEEQREAIAGICGYTEEEPWLDGRRCWHLKGESKHVGHSEIPDYLNDLNAMHEAEKTLTGRYHRYARELVDICQAPEDAIFANSEQRAWAFLRVHGKWEEGK